MKKIKNPFLKAAVALLVVSMLAGALFAGNTTLARYTATASGAGTADVARFLVELDGDDITGPGTTLTSPFAVIMDTKAASGDPDCTGQGDAQDADVAPGKIAPGTKGLIAGGTIVNLSDVTVRVRVQAQLTGTANWPETVGQRMQDVITFTGLPSGVALVPGAAAVTIAEKVLEWDATGDNELVLTDIGWTWAFDGDNTNDTTLGRLAADPGEDTPTLGISYSIIVDQID
jgi:hypothetical protein